KEIADVVGLEYFNQPLVLPAVLFQAFEFVAARPESAGRRMAQCADRFAGVLTGIDQIFGQRTNDPIAAGINCTYPAGLLAGSFDYTRGRGIDDGGHPAGLSIKSIFR